MKAIIILFISLCLFSFINLTCEPDEENNKIRDSDDCKDRAFSSEEIEDNKYKCCYMRTKVNLNTRKGKLYQCIGLTKNEYDVVKDLIKKYEAETGVDDVKIDCNSSYIKFGLLSLLLLFF